MKYYYTNKDHQICGPVTLDEIRDLVKSGGLPDNPLVVPEGGKDWQPLSSIGRAPGDATASEGAAPGGREAGAAPRQSCDYATIMGGTVGRLADALGRVFSPGRIDCCLRHARAYGHYALLASAALVLAYSIFSAIRHNDLGAFIAGVISVLAIAVGQFVVLQFLDAGEKLIAATPGRLGSNAVMRCLGLVAFVTAVCLLAGGIIGSIEGGSVLPLLMALAAAAMLALGGGIALNPSSVNVEIGSGSSGEEAVGLVMFFLKIQLKIVPAVFIIFAVLGGLVTLLSFFMEPWELGVGGSILLIPDPFLWLLSGVAGAPLLIQACAVPLLAYLFFIFASLFFDVLRAILALPEKIESLRRQP